MANECLVTKLKGSVQNDNLPVLNQIKFNINSQGGTAVYIMMGGDNKTIHINSTVELHQNSPSGAAITSADISSNMTRAYYTTSGQAAQGVITITGDIYDILSFAVNNEMSFQQNSGIESSKYFKAEGLCIPGRKDITLANTNVKICKITKDGVDFSEIPDNIKFIYVEPTIDNINWYALTDNDGSAKTHNAVEGIRGRVLFSLEDCPTNLKVIYSNTSGTDGSVEAYIAKCVASGRTSGTVAIYPYVNNITYNGTVLSELVTAGTIPLVRATYENVPYIVVSWEGNTISFLNSLPTEYDRISEALASPGYWPYIVNNY